MAGTIKPEDFADRVTDPNYRTWTLGTIEHVVEAMQGRPALVEVDKRTGCSFVGEIVGYATSGDRNPGARLKFRHESGQITNYLLWEIGVIVDLTPMGGAKWDALKAYRDARSEALRTVREREEIPFEGSFEVYGLGHREEEE